MSLPLLDTRSAYLELVREDFSTFLYRTFQTLNPGRTLHWGWHLDAMANVLDETRRGKSRRVLITIPPRHLKSITVAVAWPAYMLGLNPNLRFMVASYGGELAQAHARDFRTVVTSAWYQAAFPEMRLVTSSLRDLRTTKGGGRRSVTPKGVGTGLGADFIVIDDLMKAADAPSPNARQRVKSYYTGTLLSRLEEKATGRIIVIQQRLHEDDLPGFLLETGKFLHLNLPAIAEEDELIPLGGGRVHRRRRGEVLSPEREPLAVLEEMRVEFGARDFSAQWQQRPVVGESQLVRWELIQRYGEALPRESYEQVVQSWDVATTSNPGSDYSVCTTWGFNRSSWRLLDLARLQLPYPQLLAAVRTLRRRWRADVVLVERADAGRPLYQDLWADLHEGPHGEVFSWQVQAYQPRVSKATRLAAQVDKLESGFAMFPEQAPWLEGPNGLRHEMLGFPDAKHDDQVDSVTQFLEWAGRLRNRPAERPSGAHRRP